MGGMHTFRCWLESTARLHGRVSQGLSLVAFFSARRPCATVSVCLALSLLSGLGLLRLRLEVKATNLWVDQDSDAMLNRKWIEANFASGGMPTVFLIEAKNRGHNVLTVDAVSEAFELFEEVRSIKTEDVVRSSVFGAFQVSGSELVSAPVWRMGFVLSQHLGKDTTLQWEKTVIDEYVSSSYEHVEQKWDHIHVELFSAARSVDDELARVVGGDLSFVSLGFVFLVTTAAFALGHPLRCVQGRRVLGISSFFVVVFGTLGGYGLASAVGIPFTSLQLILPFILVGIGVDNAFVIVGAFDRTAKSKSIEERIRDAMMLEGMSVTMTSATDVLAFLCGATSSYPAVVYFCLCAASSLMYTYVLQLTAFCSLLALDAHRQQSSRMDVVCCVRTNRTPGALLEDGDEPFAVRVMEMYARAITRNWLVKLAVVSGILALGGACLWQALENMDTAFDISDLSPDSSYVRDYFAVEEKYWGADTSALNIPVHVVFRDVDESDAVVQREMRRTEDEALQLRAIDSAVAPHSWHRSFTEWALANEGTRADLATDQFQSVEGHRFLAGPGFYTALSSWLDDDDLSLGQRFRNDVVFEDGEVRHSRIVVIQVTMSESRMQVEALTEAEAFYRGKQAVLPGTIAHAHPWVFYDQYRNILSETFWATLMCFIAVSVVSLFVLSHPLVVLIVSGVITLVYIDLLGCLPLIGQPLNSISMINLVMAVGLVVDYSMHVAHSFMAQHPQLSRDERVVLAMKSIGVSVSKGLLSTLVGVLPLSLGSSKIFRVFFNMLVLILAVGGTHGPARLLRKEACLFGSRIGGLPGSTWSLVNAIVSVWVFVFAFADRGEESDWFLVARAGEDAAATRPEPGVRDTINPDMVGVEFMTRAARSADYASCCADLSGVYPSPEDSGREDAVGTGRRVRYPSHHPLVVRVGRFLDVSGLVSFVYVLGCFAVEPACVKPHEGSAGAWLQNRSLLLGGVLAVASVLNALTYAALSVAGIFLFGRVDPQREEELSKLHEVLASHLRSWGFWLDAASMLGTVAEIAHLWEAPKGGVPTPLQWAMLLQLGKAWRVSIKDAPRDVQEDGHLFLKGVVWIFFKAGASLSGMLRVAPDRLAAGAFALRSAALRVSGSVPGTCSLRVTELCNLGCRIARAYGWRLPEGSARVVVETCGG
ncbi:unnamed protein product [Prorocentrum cordatum]|uniref:SSD domain-containing protein n=1 Tax=Prorocentrum cordatum TaxID=2364126 RepID=A0ABN9TGC7_9DINO|nr:unnamed protein product [Polarella glacialis]